VVMVGLDAAGHGHECRRPRQHLQRHGRRDESRSEGQGTLVVLNDTIHYARNVVKTDTTSVQTFESINRRPAGLVNTGKVFLVRADGQEARGPSASSRSMGLDKLPRVDVIYAHAQHERRPDRGGDQETERRVS